MPRVAAVAAGNGDTARAAATVLRAGGNAVDAVVAAGFAAAVAEPGLSSLGGGGFLLWAPVDGPERLLDFFVDAPGRGRSSAPAAPPLPITVSFSGVDQVFHAGWGSVAVPGCLDGYLQASRQFGRLPLTEVVAPAAALARDGVVLDATQAGFLLLLREIVLLTREGRGVFAPSGRLLRAGDRLRNRDLADLLDDVGRGVVAGVCDLAEPLAEAAAAGGGRLSVDDLTAYEVVERVPLRTSYREAQLVTNPAPSFGGTLVLAALRELESQPVLDQTPAAAARLAAALVRMSERHVAGPTAVRGTTHVSVVDGDGGLAAMTMSNGSCSGVFAPGTGIQLNNVMGEADLHPQGFQATAPGVRIGSMMAPTVVRTADGTRTALGSGGSERIRSALLCALVGLIDRGEPLADAVAAPRLHWDRTLLQVEPGLDPAALAALADLHPLSVWASKDLYFGGVHSVARRPDGAVEVVGDVRRSGAVEVVELP